jgi:hypothetical protein
MSTFAERTQELEDLVGHGDLIGTVVVDQILGHLRQISARGAFSG